MDQTSIKLRWNAIDNYEKSTVQYKLECFKCSSDVRNGRVDSTSSPYSKSSVATRTSTTCHERVACESYVEMSPRRDELFDNMVALSALDADTAYVFELHAEHVKGAFKTKTVDVMVRTLPPVGGLQVHNLTAFQFVDMNQILVAWSEPSPVDVFSAYEIRYWPRGNTDKASVLAIRAPARNFTFKNSNPSVISNNLYVFQIRGKSNRGWTSYSEPPCEAVKISSASFFYSRDNAQIINVSLPASSFYSNWMVTKDAAFTSMATSDHSIASVNIKSANSKFSMTLTLKYGMHACTNDHVECMHVCTPATFMQ